MESVYESKEEGKKGKGRGGVQRQCIEVNQVEETRSQRKVSTGTMVKREYAVRNPARLLRKAFRYLSLNTFLIFISAE